MSRSKRHHVQPQSYLQCFTDPKHEGCIWMYRLGVAVPSLQQPYNVALETNYNTLRRADGTLDDTLESMLSELEGEALKVVRKIENQELLSDDGRMTFALFVSSMLLRSQRTRAVAERTAQDITDWAYGLIASSSKWRDETARWLEVVRDSTSETFEADLKREIAGVDLRSNEDRRRIGLSLYGSTAKFGDLFYAMHWTFLDAGDGYGFLTSDNPVTYAAPTRDPSAWAAVGLKHADIEVTFPVTRRFALVANWSEREDRFAPCSKKRVDAINERTVAAAKRFVYAPFNSRRLARRIQALEPME